MNDHSARCSSEVVYNVITAATRDNDLFNPTTIIFHEDDGSEVNAFPFYFLHSSGTSTRDKVGAKREEGNKKKKQIEIDLSFDL